MPANWVPIGFAVYVVMFTVTVGSVFLWKVKRRGGRRPVDFKLLRGPGESLRRRIAKSDEDSIPLIIGAALMPLFAVAPVLWFTTTFRPTTWSGAWVAGGVAIVVFLVALFFSGRRVFRDLKRYRNDCLGYLGEREVGEQLEPLLRAGYRIFHDVPAEGAKADFNLDHVVVGPTGVALVETKTLRKGKAVSGRKDHVVTYDGAKLIWPWGSENRHGLDQTLWEAEWLEKFIRQRTGLDVAVRPILTFPGWWVELKGSGPVTVVNSKNLVSVIQGSGGSGKLSDNDIDLIARQLDVFCRDVVD